MSNVISMQAYREKKEDERMIKAAGQRSKRRGW